MFNMDNTHEGILATFEVGALSIRWTPRSFVRCIADLTLKQKISKYPASCHTGINAFTQCVKASKR